MSKRSLRNTGFSAAIAISLVCACTFADSARDRAPRGELDSIPLVRVGGRDDDPLFRVAGGVMTAHGLIVAGGGSQSLRYYDLQGQLQRITGRKGAGPGEFEDLAWIQKVNGNVAAYDQDRHRVSFFGPQGDFLRSVHIRPPNGYLNSEADGVLADGSILAHAWPSGWQPETRPLAIRSQFFYMTPRAPSKTASDGSCGTSAIRNIEVDKASFARASPSGGVPPSRLPGHGTTSWKATASESMSSIPGEPRFMSSTRGFRLHRSRSPRRI